MAKPWIGLPIEPCLISPEGGFSVANPTSVIPYPSTIGKPAAAANSLSSSVETLSAPARHIRSEQKSPGRRSWS
jgi:hypothetical protein